MFCVICDVKLCSSDPLNCFTVPPPFPCILDAFNELFKNLIVYGLKFLVILPPFPWKIIEPKYKLDGVGPVDNRPSTKKLHHFLSRTV